MRLLNEALLRVMTWTRRDEGQTLVEYALIIALVSVVLAAALIALRGGIEGVFNDIVSKF